LNQAQFPKPPAFLVRSTKSRDARQHMLTHTTSVTLHEKSVQVTQFDALKNYYFCGGLGNPFFYDQGQKDFPEWASCSMEEVLIQRVKSGVKPVASIVLDDKLGSEHELLVEAAPLFSCVIKNEWRVRELLITATPNATLFDLLRMRGSDGVDLEFKGGLLEKVKGKTVRDYMHTGFDYSAKGEAYASLLECALLFGYPLDQARADGRHTKAVNV
jgi:uncharacterized protein (DUF2164 family)